MRNTPSSIVCDGVFTSRIVPLHDHAGLSPGARAVLEATIQQLQTLADVLSWARGHAPPLSVVEIVTQDEYTHDVVLESAGRSYLAFDTT